MLEGATSLVHANLVRNHFSVFMEERAKENILVWIGMRPGRLKRSNGPTMAQQQDFLATLDRFTNPRLSLLHNR